MINSVFIGKIIKQFRRKNNLTQEELAEKIDISKNYLSKVERGLSRLNAESFLKIAEVLSFTFEDFGIKVQPKIDFTKQEIIKNILACSEKEAEVYLKMISIISPLAKSKF